MVGDEKNNVPWLRFSEFGGTWNSSPLNLLTQIYDGTHQTPTYVKEGVPFYSVEHITADNFTNTKYIAEDVYQNEIKRITLEKDDVLMTRIGDIGTSKLIDWDVRASFYVSLALIKQTKNLNSKFLDCAICTNSFQKELYKRTIHVAFPKKINLGEIGNCILNYPQNHEEQQKIASFLGFVDDKLKQLRRKHILLKTYKRGLMQKIFSQELRFKQDDGADFPDWEEKSLGDVYDWVKTNNLSREMLTNQKGDVRNIHYGDIHTKFLMQFDQDKVNAPFIKDLKAREGISEAEFCKNGDIVIADASEDYKDIGKAVEIVNVKPKSLVAGLHTYIARPRMSKVVGFSGYLFQSHNLRKQIMRIAQGVSVLGISKTNLAKLVIPQPVPDEQQKIAEALSTLDKKIEAVATQITQMVAFKKGLLQKMFV